MEYINCRLRSLEIENKELPPDVEIEWNGGYYVQMEFKNGTRGEGIQTDDNNYKEKKELCRKISDAMFQLQKVIEEEEIESRKEEGING